MRRMMLRWSILFHCSLVSSSTLRYLKGIFLNTNFFWTFLCSFNCLAKSMRVVSCPLSSQAVSLVSGGPLNNSCSCQVLLSKKLQKNWLAFH
uniref:Putative secreted protein n=1 Tax=Ixodes ricinus TaxID=34613 RepID=A0A6B0UH48_IXORI